MENIGLRMLRIDLENLPAATLPEGFHFRTYRAGDREIWVQLYSAAEQYCEITPELFDREFYGDEDALAQRMLFLFNPDGMIIGTSTAWYDDISQSPESGRVHWVAIHPEYQGQGLGRALLAETLHMLRKLGHTSAYLLTSSARLPALSLYLGFGYVPDIETPTQYEAWRQVAGLLRPELGTIVERTLLEFPGETIDQAQPR